MSAPTDAEPDPDAAMQTAPPRSAMAMEHEPTDSTDVSRQLRSSASPLTTLPMELLEKICSYLELRSIHAAFWEDFPDSSTLLEPEKITLDPIRALRLTCRELAFKCRAVHVKKKFEDTHVRFTKVELARLLRRSRSKIVSQYSRSLTILVISIDAKPTDSFLERSSGHLSIWAENERVVRDSGIHAALLTMILNNLKNVDTVNIHSESYEPDLSSDLRHLYPLANYAYATVLSALEVAGSNVASLNITELRDSPEVEEHISPGIFFDRIVIGVRHLMVNVQNYDLGGKYIGRDLLKI